MDMLFVASTILGSYLLGSIPSGLILTRIFLSTDLRMIGSGNIGATNARRAGGSAFGLIVLLCDLAKGAVPALLAVVAIGMGAPLEQLSVTLIALAAFVGHVYPVYLGFKSGGKGVATAAGCFLVLSPPAFIIALGVFILTVYLSRRASAGSLAAAAALPLIVLLIEKSLILAAGALVVAVLVFLRHRGNIARLLSGTEPMI